MGGAGRAPEVTCSAREAEAATAAAELRSCGVHPALTLSPGSNRKSPLYRPSVSEAISALLGLRIQRCLVHALPGLPLMCRLLLIEDCTPVCLSPSRNRQHPLSVPWGCSPSEFLGSQWRVSSPSARCIALSLCPQRSCVLPPFLSVSQTRQPPPPVLWDVESRGFGDSRGLEGLERMGESALQGCDGWG